MHTGGGAHVVELVERAMDDLRFAPGRDLPALLACQLGLWLRPVLGAPRALSGRVIEYDYGAHRFDRDRQIATGIAAFLLRGYDVPADALSTAADAICGFRLRRTGPVPAREQRDRDVG